MSAGVKVWDGSTYVEPTDLRVGTSVVPPSNLQAWNGSEYVLVWPPPVAFLSSATGQGQTDTPSAVESPPAGANCVVGGMGYNGSANIVGLYNQVGGTDYLSTALEAGYADNTVTVNPYMGAMPVTSGAVEALMGLTGSCYCTIICAYFSNVDINVCNSHAGSPFSGEYWSPGSGGGGSVTVSLTGGSPGDMMVTTFSSSSTSASAGTLSSNASWASFRGYGFGGGYPTGVAYAPATAGGTSITYTSPDGSDVWGCGLILTALR